ncbi:DUF3151 domain-containing protein [Haloechinothrix sp. LS1_15]|uniref:DUF3151 domain-containing protein n=1 Tax=Haloechinothrix sp. LS1_15 TaxID=2652248 RepID=UPI00294808C4|nr:DUF3151 domain-containing protein [Haloechinothrix sp. LS1_15]MDV6011175.1 DUF3151 domain-containing protein [Haloechinothrix sp. LS1_15]
MTQSNLLGPEPTLLPDRPDAQAAMDADTSPAEVAAEHPDFSEAWAALAERSLEAGEHVAAYAYARTGYHRGLDHLRKSGWKGHGPVPWQHRPNQGFLRSVAALARAAHHVGEIDEYQRCVQLLDDSDPEARTATGLS